jgi:hypothetical protein
VPALGGKPTGGFWVSADEKPTFVHPGLNDGLAPFVGAQGSDAFTRKRIYVQLGSEWPL